MSEKKGGKQALPEALRENLKRRKASPKPGLHKVPTPKKDVPAAE